MTTTERHLALRTVLQATGMRGESPPSISYEGYSQAVALFVELVGQPIALRLAEYIHKEQLSATDLQVIANDDTSLRCLAAVIGMTQ